MKFRYYSKDDSITPEKALRYFSEKFTNKVFSGWPEITLSQKENKNLVSQLEERGITVRNYKIDAQEYLDYLDEVNYKKKYPRYYPGNFHEKTLEHFLAYKIFKLSKGHKFIDIAAEKSPHCKIFQRLTGCIGYKQDIRYWKGVRFRKIGGDASKIPIKDNFFHAVLAACSIEHFENDSDIGFMKEVPRILDLNGKIVITPLYLHKKAFCLTDPRFSIPQNVTFDPGIDIHCVNDWGNRHGRFYSPDTLFKRLIEPNLNRMTFSVYYFENFKEIHSSVYCRFALVGEKFAV